MTKIQRLSEHIFQWGDFSQFTDMLTKTKTLVRNKKFHDYRHIYDGKHNLTCILCRESVSYKKIPKKMTCKVFIRICVCVQKLFCKGIIKRFEKLTKDL